MKKFLIKYLVPIFTVVISFALGFSLGSSRMKLGEHGLRPPFSHELDARPRVKALKRKLNLDDSQEKEIQDILSRTRKEIEEIEKDVRPRFSELREKTDQEILKLLTKEQVEVFLKHKKRFKNFHPRERQRPFKERSQKEHFTRELR